MPDRNLNPLPIDNNDQLALIRTLSEDARVAKVSLEDSIEQRDNAIITAVAKGIPKLHIARHAQLDVSRICRITAA